MTLVWISMHALGPAYVNANKIEKISNKNFSNFYLISLESILPAATTLTAMRIYGVESES